MSDRELLAQRLNFMQLDEEARAKVRSVKPLIDKTLPAALDTFYARLRQFPEASRFFSGADHQERAKGGQLRHWGNISSGDFNESYLRTVRIIGETHARIGLNPNLYIDGYALIVQELINALVKDLWPKGLMNGKASKAENVSATIGALVKSVMLDMGFAISIYIDASEETRRKVETEVDSLVKSVVAGDFSRRIPIEGKTGFMLNLANSMNALSENVATAMTDLGTMLEALAEGDLTRRMTADYQGVFEKLKNDANRMTQQIAATVTQIKTGAGEVASAAAEISASTTDLSQRTEEQAASLEQTSASMVQLATTVKKNAENAQQANGLAANTRDVAERGGEVVAKTVNAMSRIEESSRKISDIIGVIDEIAFQTNLLALNAAVEAARAGEAGRGFAVVASEVRRLAQRSSQAAKDIKELINNSSGQVKEGVDLVNRAGVSLTEIVESIKQVATIVSDIANASAEQATGIDEVNKALTQMDEVTQQNSALVEENAATAKTLEEQSAAMNDRVSIFRLDGADGRSEGAQLTNAPAKVVTPASPVRSAAVSKRPLAARSGGARGGQAALATAVKAEPDWKEF